MKTLTFVAYVAVAASATFPAFAGSEGAVGTDWVVTADAGETYTASTAIGNYSRLVKQGDGEVVLTAAASGFTGTTVVEEGTLTVAQKNAVGDGAISVLSGATLHLKLPGGTQFGHAITIAGKGVGDAGAFKYTKDGGSSNSDSLINKLELSADATIDASGRWGMANDKILDLHGHTLTRIGKGNWMVYNHIQSTGAPGDVNNVYGTLTFQGSPDIDENVTVVVTNIDESCVLGLWGASSVGTIKGKIKLYSGRAIQAQSGSAKTSNNIGPLHLAGPKDASATLTIQKDNAVRTMSVDGPVTSDNGMKLSIEGIGSIWFNNDVSLSGNTTFACGNAYLCGDESKRDMKLVLNKSTTVTHEAGKTYARMLRVANGGAHAAQLRQTGGIFAVGSGDNARLAGESNGSRGYYTLEGGELHLSNSVFMAEWRGSFGAFRQTGGLMEMKRPANGTNDRTFLAGRGGSAVFVQTGGTNDTLAVSNSQNGGFQTTTNGTSEVTISGTGTLFRTTLFQMGVGNPSTNILNISDGAVFKAHRFRKSDAAKVGTRAYVNVDGGTIMPTYAWGWGAVGGSEAAFYKRSPDHVVVWRKGMTIDTSENATGGTGESSLSLWFEKPTGNGVESITLPDLTGKTYIGLGKIVIEDETGWGASAYAEFDFSTKTLTRVVVTSRGCDYSENAKAYLESPAGTTRYECAITLTSNEGMCGEFVKRGAPILCLYATNTITGGIAVEQGELRTYTGGVMPSNTPVRVESGATLNLYSKGDITVSTFTGAGTVNNGAVTVTNAVRATCAELFANKHATFGGNLTFAPGATFTITDPENLEAYKQQGAVAAFTAAAVNGTPTLAFEGEAPQGVKWSLFKKNGTTYNFGAVIGTMFFVR